MNLTVCDLFRLTVPEPVELGRDVRYSFSAVIDGVETDVFALDGWNCTASATKDGANYIVYFATYEDFFKIQTGSVAGRSTVTFNMEQTASGGVHATRTATVVVS